MDLSILVYVLILIALAKLLGEALSRINQPSIVGELLAGILLGPFIFGKVFGELEDMYSDETLMALADLGILFLMLFVGMEFSPRALVTSSRLGGAISALGLIIPLILGLYVGALFDIAGPTLIFLAVAVSVSALPVTMRILKDMEVLNTHTGKTIVSASLITDLALLFVMGILLGDSDYTSTYRVLYLAAGFILFFALAYVIGRYVVPYLYKVLRWMRTGEAAFTVAVGIAIAFAVFAEKIGIPAFIGAFIAGLLLRETGTGLKVWARVEDILSGVTMGFLAPIFFVRIGFEVDLGAASREWLLLAAVASAAIVGKIAGSFIPARLMGLGEKESLAIGSMMMGKGAMELVFAQLALEQGVIDETLFSVLVLMAFISTFLAPVMFSYFYNSAIQKGELTREESPEPRAKDLVLP